MSLLSMIFGKREIVHTGTANVEFIGAISSKEWAEQVGVTIERHSRTGKERAFIHRINGITQRTSVEVVKSVILEAGHVKD